MEKISVIIPVHNGAKYIEKTAKGILNQTYKNIELILVENFSSDNSLEICKSLEKKDNRVHTIQSFERGTSLARKKGIEYASGEYIIFSDQDDKYINDKSIECMYKAIKEDSSQIVQFGQYTEYSFGLKRNRPRTQENKFFSREQLLNDEIKGIFGVTNSVYNVNVWSKIYSSLVLKDAVKNITKPLFYAEDEYLNVWTFLNENVQQVSVRNESYYVWKTGVGFSSSKENSKVLFDDYEIVKNDIFVFAEKYHINDDILFSIHLESIYLCKVLIDDMIRNNKPLEKIIQKIEDYEQYTYIQKAKDYFNSLGDDKRIYDELLFLASDYTPKEYYEYCVNHLKKPTLRNRILNLLR